MYIPPSFAENNLAELHQFIEGHGFATIISTADGEPIGSHLPILLDRSFAPYGRLYGHLARANSHQESFGSGRSLVIFHGPHAYISPDWMPSQNVVPTWNYVAVHAYGSVRRIEDRDRLCEIVRQTTVKYESSRATPWSMNAPDPDFIEKLLGAIVGFEIDIERLEGKWKLNQNHPPERRQHIINGLRAAGRHDELQIADLMERTL
jgi:transcriptional regulator